MRFYSRGCFFLCLFFFALSCVLGKETTAVTSSRFIDINVPYGEFPFIPQCSISQPQQILYGKYFGQQDLTVSFSFYETSISLITVIDVIDNHPVAYNGIDGDRLNVRFYRARGEEVALTIGNDEDLNFPHGIRVKREKKARSIRYEIELSNDLLVLMHNQPMFFLCDVIDDDVVNKKIAHIDTLPVALFSTVSKSKFVLNQPKYFGLSEQVEFYGEYYGSPKTVRVDYRDRNNSFLFDLKGDGAFTIQIPTLFFDVGRHMIRFLLNNEILERSIEVYNDKKVFFSIDSEEDKIYNDILSVIEKEIYVSPKDSTELMIFKSSDKNPEIFILCSSLKEVAKIFYSIPDINKKNIGVIAVSGSPSIFEVLDVRDYLITIEYSVEKIILWQETANWIRHFNHYLRNRSYSIIVAAPPNSVINSIVNDEFQFHDCQVVVRDIPNNHSSHSLNSIFHKRSYHSTLELFLTCVSIEPRNISQFKLIQNDIKFHQPGPFKIFEQLDSTKKFALSWTLRGKIPVMTTENIKMFQYSASAEAILILNGVEAKIQPNSVNTFYYFPKKNEWIIYNQDLPVAPVLSDLFLHQIKVNEHAGLPDLWQQYFQRRPGKVGSAEVYFGTILTDALIQEFNIKSDEKGFWASNGEYVSYSKRFLTVFSNNGRLLLFCNIWKPDYFYYPYTYILFSEKNTIDKIGYAWHP